MELQITKVQIFDLLREWQVLDACGECEDWPADSTPESRAAEQTEYVWQQLGGE